MRPATRIKTIKWLAMSAAWAGKGMADAQTHERAAWKETSCAQ
jgi:hypothetical protein